MDSYAKLRQTNARLGEIAARAMRLAEVRDRAELVIKSMKAEGASDEQIIAVLAEMASEPKTIASAIDKALAQRSTANSRFTLTGEAHSEMRKSGELKPQNEISHNTSPWGN